MFEKHIWPEVKTFRASDRLLEENDKCRQRQMKVWRRKIADIIINWTRVFSKLQEAAFKF